jgi:hypothetical protein
MEPKALWLCLQTPAPCAYREPDQCSARHHILFFWRYILILSFHLLLGLPSRLFLSGFSTNTLQAPLFSLIPATCPVHLTLYLITRMIFGEEHISWSFSLCSLLQSPVVSFLHPNYNLLLEETLFSWHFADHKSHVDSLETDARLLRWEPFDLKSIISKKVISVFGGKKEPPCIPLARLSSQKRV